MMAGALQRESDSVKMVADWVAQNHFGRSIFGKGLPLPEIPSTVQPLHRGMDPRQAQQAQLRDFYRDLYDHLPAPQA